MCGLAGFRVTSASAGSGMEAIARAMAARIAYRGPDDEGVWVDAERGIAVAHRRLSILDLSAAGHQPMLSASGRFVLVFNGEIYNHLDLRRRLAVENAAPAWRGHSDTETLLAGIEAWGIESALKRSTGMFAFALWDRAGGSLILARDRMGEKPLYYGWQGETFLFGSELKALRAHPAFNAAVDRGALALLLRHNYIPAPHSIWQGIHKLPPGTWLRLDPGQRKVEPTPYWSLAEVAEQGMAHPFQGSDGEALEILEQQFGKAVRGQMVADVPLGVLLSGGIDSTAVAALMQANSARPIHTFTIGFNEREYDEADHARAVAAHLGTEHVELRLGGADALALVPRLPEIYDEPFADSSQLPTHLVMRLARRHVTVALSGDAGDEMFGGYNRYWLVPKVWRYSGWMAPGLRASLARGIARLPSRMSGRLPAAISRQVGIVQGDDKLHKLVRVLGSPDIRGVDDLYISLVSEWLNAEGMVVDGCMPSNLLDDRPRWPKLDDAVARIMALDGLTYLPDDILAKVDRAAMAVSLETRAPFLDRHLIEFAWSLPMHMKIRGGRGKWLLRRLVDRHVPAALMERPKMGFGLPLDQWLRGPLREWAETLLAEDRLKREDYLDPVPVRAAWRRHQRGEASFGYRLWSVLMFQAWLEHQGQTP